MSARPASFVLVIGHEPELAHEAGAAALLRQLGAEVRTLEFFADSAAILRSVEQGAAVRAIVIEGGERPDLASLDLRAARREPLLEHAPALLAVPERQVTRVEPSSGFDDFILCPIIPGELYARIRALEWKHSEFLNEERLKMGALVIDSAAHEVTLDGRRVSLTAKEFSLLAFLASNRGRVFSRENLLARVWGSGYDGGARTVDIHVRRLRAKLGDALPLETLRGAGYKLRAPNDPVDGTRLDGIHDLDASVVTLDSSPRPDLRKPPVSKSSALHVASRGR
jgi:DNA-binding response OmpR family regulator